MLRLLLSVFVSLYSLGAVATAQEQPRHYSQCQAIAQSVPGAMFARYDPPSLPVVSAALADQVVRLTFLGHSTFHIETRKKVAIATDYSGYHRPAATPDVVTMNRAHGTHYTLTPDPEIAHVLHGWSDDPARKAEHSLVLRDTFIRNVTSDIRGMADGNSIFIFEVAGLCIGHLGHLHQELSEGQYAEIGRLDVVMVPVDGGLTMGAESMSRVIQRLRSSLILPMHRPGPSVERFLSMMGPDFQISLATSNTVDVSLSTLPRKPTILLMLGMQ